MADKVQRMHVAVSAALEGISTMFKPGMKLTFIARAPGNPEGDVLIGDDQDPLELIALVQRRFTESAAISADAPAELYMGVAVGMEHTGATITVMEKRGEVTTVRYAGKHPVGETISRIDLAAAPVAADARHQAATTQAARDVLAERQRQVEEEGRTAADDDFNVEGHLAVAAGYYALACGYPHERDIGRGALPTYWPWAPSWWKPRSKRENLVRAGALVLAEIERLDRAAAPAGDLTAVDCPACDGKAACDECCGQGKVIVSRTDMAALAPVEHDHSEGSHHD